MHRSEERRVGKECRSLCDWSSDVCSSDLFVILKGWACRYKLLPEGTRQITSFLMPGDCGDLHASVSHRMEHSIATLTPARVAKVDRKEMEDLIETRPAIMRAFLWTLLVDEDTLRAWIVSMGRRDSVRRVAHLMCELYVRALNIGLAVGDRFEMPLTQIVLGGGLVFDRKSVV